MRSKIKPSIWRTNLAKSIQYPLIYYISALIIYYQFLTKLVNVSLQNGVFSQKWKVAIVNPLLKKLGMELISSSYRPISNLKFVSKLVESCAMDRLNKHCFYNRLIPDYQSAYRRFYSCETSVLKLVNDILWGMECQEISSLIVCNLSAAFDTVDHLLLLDILSNKFGVGGTALNWFDSYLHPRSLQVMIGKEFSSERDLPLSVPQGKLCRVHSYLIYIVVHYMRLSYHQIRMTNHSHYTVLPMTIQYTTNSRQMTDLLS